MHRTVMSFQQCEKTEIKYNFKTIHTIYNTSNIDNIGFFSVYFIWVWK